MSFFRLLLRNLLYHWRGNLAVFLGIALGSAVLTGALLVGDSLHGSLRALTLDQLGWVDNAMIPGRFFRDQLATEIGAEHKSAALLLRGNAARKGADERVGKVTILGVDAFFWGPPPPHPLSRPGMPESVDFWQSQEAGVVLNSTLATALEVKAGDTIELYVPKANQVPGETLMGQRTDTIQKLTLKLHGVVNDEGMARFSLKPTPEPVRNAFVPIRYLQQKLDLAGRANALLAAEPASDWQRHLTLDDWGLRYRSPADRAEAFFRLLQKNSTSQRLIRTYWQDKSGKTPVNRIPDRLAEVAERNGGVLTRDDVLKYYEENRDYHVLESRRMLLEPQVVRAALKLGPANPDAVPKWKPRPVMIYLADTISDGKLDVPYSIIASDDRTISGKDGKEDYVLRDDQILLMRWPGSPLVEPRIKPGSVLTISYYLPDERNNLRLQTEKFKVHSLEDIQGAHDDPDLVPEMPGVTDKLDIQSWVNPPFPYVASRNKRPDVEYSIRYRTTPRAYVNLRTAQRLWGNRFGDVTSIQVRHRDGTEPAEKFAPALLKELNPEQAGFVFQPIRAQALKASAGNVDFGEYFLYFSFFLIVSALLLVGLLVRLNLDRRAGEIGLLMAIGWDYRQVRRLLLAEAALLAIVGALVGLAGAAIYAGLMLKLLSATWPGSDGLSFLRLHADEHSIIHGFAASLLVSIITLWWAMRGLGKMSPRALLMGETTQSVGLADTKLGWSRWLIPSCALGAVGLAVMSRFMPAQEAQAGCFFGSGALLLTACLAAVWNGLNWSKRQSSPQPSLTRLGLRNAGRNGVRSVLTVGLLAAASFLIVAVESFHKETDDVFAKKTGGSGGFAFVAEGVVPLFEDFNDPKVLRAHQLDTPAMRTVNFYPCRLQGGDDASCLNLYKPLKPRVLGVSNAFIQRGGFHFGATTAKTDDEKANPWLLLQRQDDDAIPAIVDATTAKYNLKVGLGETIDVKDEKGDDRKLRVVGLLDESIFQSEVVVAEAQFLKLYPQQTGFAFLLIDAENADAAALRVLESQLTAALLKENMDVQTAASRLQGYLAVENTYLATFQALGGLGLILGAVGLAIVLLRGVWERRAELALMQALGFRSGQLAWLVLVENAFLLVLGLAAGTVSALLAVAPHLVGSGAGVLWARIAALLGLVLLVGLVSAMLAVWSTLKTPVLTALRRE